VQEARRYVQVREFDVVEPERPVFTEGGRRQPRIDEHVVHGAVCAADELGLTGPRTTVQAAEHPPAGAGLRVLHERVRIDSRVPCHGDIEGPGEQSAVVVIRGWHEQEQAVERRLVNLHEAILAGVKGSP